MSSIAARGSIAGTAYGAAKGAIEGITRSAAIEVAKHGITVNCVAPGLIDAGIFLTVPQDYQERGRGPDADEARRDARGGRRLRLVPRLARCELRHRSDPARLRRAVAWLLRCAPSAEGHVAVVTIDNPPVNALHPDVAPRSTTAAARPATTRSVRAIVLTGAGEKHFMAGGDIKYIQTLDALQGRALRLRRPGDAGPARAAAAAGDRGAERHHARRRARARDGLRHPDRRGARASSASPRCRSGSSPAPAARRTCPRLVPVGPREEAALHRRADRRRRRRSRSASSTRSSRAGASLGRAVELGEEIAAQRADGRRRRQAGREPRPAGRAASTAHRIEGSLFAPLTETEDFKEGIDAFFEKRPPEYPPRSERMRDEDRSRPRQHRGGVGPVHRADHREPRARQARRNRDRSPLRPAPPPRHRHRDRLPDDAEQGRRRRGDGAASRTTASTR